MRLAAKRYRAAAVVIAASLVLVGCGDALQEPKLVKRGLSDLSESDVELERAKSENQNRLIDPKFAGKLDIIDDPSGIEAARAFFDDSDSMVLFAPDDKSVLRAATLAINQHLPAVEYDRSRRGDILNLVGDLEVKRLVIVGDIPWTQSSGDFTVIKDPGTHEALGDFTAFQYESKVVASPNQVVKDIARLDKTPYVELRPAWIPYEGEPDDDGKKLPAVPAQSRRDGQMAPNIVATADSPVANVITAAAYGGSVLVMPTADPLEDKRSMAMVAGLDEGSLIALGPEFGHVKEFKEKIRQGTPN
ncbi:hypothetical protein [Corynebacterium accolens]|uniref:hypothetical protein n=1 Tax=Corynebacterium accolens TaxID=38284 RepID=UPI00254D21B7|nr:hypothetical protein [Corynebacterium accolens]MDK8470359.1 hypothetical protein [Corynebacterium accolens]MDK8498407.1 hypothetical protein [Corynebacterium accolens]MDK8593208.1 hypothetical protein [Corynebacterium accolens]MDK8675841.1 hypothetical protein [Corynebacterium accolens]